jgi:hypothetical protein
VGSDITLSATVLSLGMNTSNAKSGAKKSGKWLVEIHKKLWGKANLHDSLFRTVELTSTHYRELQARLDEKHPTRNSESYEAQDVLSIKLDLLLNFTPSSPPPVIDWDDEDAQYDDMDIELQEILPEKIAFLDLSSLHLKNSVDISFPILIRQEYDIISTLINKGVNDVNSGCVLTGQSSVGKAIQSIMSDGLCLMQC